MYGDSFDASRAILKGPNLFKRYVVTDAGAPLAEAKLKPNDELIVAERGSEQRAFLARELSRPHLAQGTLAGEPYVVSF